MPLFFVIVRRWVSSFDLGGIEIVHAVTDDAVQMSDRYSRIAEDT